jgi:hypothetical protein
VMLIDPGNTDMFKGTVLLAPFLSVTVIEKGKLPLVVGVPEITPFAAVRDNPPGSAPDEIDQWYGVDPPTAATVCE